MDEPKELTKDYDYLAPDTSEIRLLPEFPEGGMAHCTLPPGKVSIAVKHQTVQEIWYFLEGEGEVWRKDEEKERVDPVKPDTCISIPVGTNFQFRNTGEIPLQFIIATMPKWPGAQEAVKVDGKW